MHRLNISPVSSIRDMADRQTFERRYPFFTNATIKERAIGVSALKDKERAAIGKNITRKLRRLS